MEYSQNPKHLKSLGLQLCIFMGDWPPPTSLQKDLLAQMQLAQLAWWFWPKDPNLVLFFVAKSAGHHFWCIQKLVFWISPPKKIIRISSIHPSPDGFTTQLNWVLTFFFSCSRYWCINFRNSCSCKQLIGLGSMIWTESDGIGKGHDIWRMRKNARKLKLYGQKHIFTKNIHESWSLMKSQSIFRRIAKKTRQGTARSRWKSSLLPPLSGCLFRAKRRNAWVTSCNGWKLTNKANPIWHDMTHVKKLSNNPVRCIPVSSQAFWGHLSQLSWHLSRHGNFSKAGWH